MVIPVTGRCCGSNGDTPLLFLIHPIHCGRAIVNFPNAMDLLRIEEHSLGDRGLSGIYVGNYANISGTL